MNAFDVIRLFGMSHQLIEADLDRVEKDLGIDLGRRPPIPVDKDESYYPQFERSVRDEAARMATHYEVLYVGTDDPGFRG